MSVAALSANAAETTIYVAADGDDAANGRTVDAPLRTLVKARDAARELKRKNGGKLPGPVTVSIAGGSYFLPEPLVLRASDSGAADAPVTWAARGDAPVIISGGARVEGWKPKETNGKTVWAAPLPERAAGAAEPRELWINGKRRTLARFPNQGYLRVADLEAGHGLEKGHTEFQFAPGSLKAWPGAAEAQAVVFNRWVESHMPIARIDEATSTVTFSKFSVFGLEKGDPYFLEGAPEFLDQPGEWYLDRKTSAIVYLPLPGEEPVKVEAVVPSLARVLVADGLPEKRELVSHVIFRGLTFAHAEYSLNAAGPGPKPSGFSQAAIGVSSLVEAIGLRSASFENCTFANAGTYGLLLGRGCQDNRVSRCSFTELGAGGVKIGETSARDYAEERAARNELSDSRIVGCGRMWPSCVGVWIGQSSDNRIIYNEIADLSYTAISTGWTWGYAPTQCHGNVVEHNHVHHIGVRADEKEPLLSDMGGIYTLGHQPGATIRFNRFHDIVGRTYGGWGIYFDEGSRDIVAEKNIVYRTTHGGLHQHYGRDNVFRNNIIAFGRDQQVLRSRAEDHKSFTFERNIVYWDRGECVMGQWTNFNATFDRNVYWRADGNKDWKIGYLTWDQWREKGLDQHSVREDPKFVDVGKDDFNLKPESPAIKLGFETWDESDVGPRPK